MLVAPKKILTVLLFAFAANCPLARTCSARFVLSSVLAGTLYVIRSSSPAPTLPTALWLVVSLPTPAAG